MASFPDVWRYANSYGYQTFTSGTVATTTSDPTSNIFSSRSLERAFRELQEHVGRRIDPMDVLIERHPSRLQTVLSYGPYKTAFHDESMYGHSTEKRAKPYQELERPKKEEPKKIDKKLSKKIHNLYFYRRSKERV